MDLSQVAKHVDLFASATIFGATVWFFFVQSPVMLKRAGRESFVPMQMKLTVVLFKTLQTLLLLAATAAAIHSPLSSAVVLTAGVGLLSGLINRHIIVPRALKAGGRSRKDIKGRDDEGSTASFASHGAGERTKTLHRLVVLFVAVMLGGVGAHLVTLVSI